VHALVGRNGAGKSTLYRVLLGFLASTGGTGRLLGFDSADLPPAARGRIGWVPESHSLPGWMRVAELTAMQRRLHPGWSETTFGEIASLFRLPSDRPVRSLSRGERAGLALALAVAPGPELLLLDEPTLGLDVVASRAFLESLLFAGERELGTIVYSSHQMAEVERVADRLIVLDRGRVVAAASPDDLRARISAWSVEEWPPGQPVESIPGLLDSRRIDDGIHLYVLDRGAAIAAELEARGARGVHPLPLSFERALDAFLQGNQGHGAAGDARRTR
jgi:ABC-2 type transport system ATP-binding protein